MLPRTAAERDDYGQVVLVQRLRHALARLSPALSAEALGDALRKRTRPAEAPSLLVPNGLLAISDGVEARVGTLGAGRECAGCPSATSRSSCCKSS